MKPIMYVLLAILVVGCSHFSNKERIVIANASITRLKIELNELPESAKGEFLSRIQKDGTSLKELERLLREDWHIKYEKFGKADDSDHKSAGCMHVYGRCVLRDDQERSWGTLVFFFPVKE